MGETEMTGPAHGTAEMEGEVEAKMTLQMLTLFLLPTTDVVEEIQMTDTATEILVIDLEIGTEIPRDLETEIATGKRRKAVKIRKEIKAEIEIEIEKTLITRKRKKRSVKDPKNMIMMMMNMS